MFGLMLYMQVSTPIGRCFSTPINDKDTIAYIHVFFVLLIRCTGNLSSLLLSYVFEVISCSFTTLSHVTCSIPRQTVRSHSLVCSENSLLIVGIGPILNKELELIFRSERSDRTCVYSYDLHPVDERELGI